MTEENSVHFKVYLVQNDAEPEIRRFSVSKDVVTSYIYLKQKLGMIFPSLRDTPFIISWRDREGDQVQIWSDEELIIALTEMDIDNKKLYVMPGHTYFNSQPQADVNERNTAHSSRSVFEQLFNISMQVFFCFISAFEHFLDRLMLTLPMSRKWELSLQQNLSRVEKNHPASLPSRLDEQCGGNNVLHGGVTCDGCEKDITGFRYKCAMCPDFDLCQDCEGAKKHSEHYMVRIPRPINRDIEFGKKMIKEFFKFNKHAMRGDHHHHHHHDWKRGGATGRDHEGRRGESFRFHRRPDIAHCPFVNPQPFPSESTPHAEPSTAQSTNRPFFDQGLPLNIEGIIESVMQGLFRMAGVEVPEPPTKEKSSAQVPPPQAQSNNAAPQTGVHFTTPSTNSTEQVSVNKPVNVENNSQEVRGAEAVITLPASPQVMEQEALGGSWTVLNKIPNPEPMQVSNTPQNNVETSKAGGDVQQVVHHPLEQNSDLFVPIRQTMSPAQSRIEEALNRMLSMGFNNEGDFLRQVLIAKNGDIEQVLDMLLPARRNQTN